MASTDHLSIDPSGVRGAAASVATGADSASTTPVAITPSAQDSTSVLVANALGALVSDLINDTAAANATAAAAAGQLCDNAEDYEQQEDANSRALSSLGGGLPGAASAPRARPALVPPMAIPAPTAAGTTPTSGREIAQLIHGGPGPGALAAAASLLKVHADQLEQAAGSIRSARHQNDAAWSSDAADAAQRHLVSLEASYTGQADQARGLAQHADTQVENFYRAKNQIPSPETFDELERRLLAASRANSAPGSAGRFSGVVAKYQTDLATANTQAVNGFSGYTSAAADVQAQARPKLATTTAAAADGPGGAPPAATTSAPGADHGSGSEPDTSGVASDDGDPAASSPLGASGGDLGEVMSSLLPAVLGGVAGVAGGLLGALSGAGEKLEQTGTQLASGLAQGASSALGAMAKPGDDPNTSGGSGGGDPSAEAGDGGGDGGGGATEPASSVDGPLSAAPASAAAAPAAAPDLYSPAAPTTSAAATGGAGMPGGGGMMPPPMMGGRGGGGAGQDDRRLFPERTLKVETPPNSEPVRMRREQRRARTERGDAKT
jgi:PPE family